MRTPPSTAVLGGRSPCPPRQSVPRGAEEPVKLTALDRTPRPRVRLRRLLSDSADGRLLRAQGAADGLHQHPPDRRRTSRCPGQHRGEQGAQRASVGRAAPTSRWSSASLRPGDAASGGDARAAGSSAAAASGRSAPSAVRLGVADAGNPRRARPQANPEVSSARGGALASGSPSPGSGRCGAPPLRSGPAGDPGAPPAGSGPEVHGKVLSSPSTPCARSLHRRWAGGRLAPRRGSAWCRAVLRGRSPCPPRKSVPRGAEEPVKGRRDSLFTARPCGRLRRPDQPVTAHGP